MLDVLVSSSRSHLDPPCPPLPPPDGGLQVLEPQDPGDQPPPRPSHVLQHEGGGRGGEAPAHHQEGHLQRCGGILCDSSSCCSQSPLHVHKLEDLVLGPRPAATQRHQVKLDTEGHGRSHEVPPTLSPSVVNSLSSSPDCESWSSTLLNCRRSSACSELRGKMKPMWTGANLYWGRGGSPLDLRNFYATFIDEHHTIFREITQKGFLQTADKCANLKLETACLLNAHLVKILDRFSSRSRRSRHFLRICV